MNGIKVTFTAKCDVPLVVAQAIHESSESPRSWEDILKDEKERNDKVNRAKKRLNRDAVSRMTVARLGESDPDGEILGWLRRIYAMLT